MLIFLYNLKIFVLILLFFPLSVLSLFEMCNHKVELKAGEKLFVNSPYYPKEYPVGSSCRYLIKAPQGYKLKFTCNIKLNTPQSDMRCLNEAFYFNREGSEILTESEYFCGTGKMERKSFLNQAVLSYTSTPNYKRLFTNVIKKRGGEESLQKTTMKKMEMNINKQQQEKSTTTATTNTTKAPKVNQLTTLSATKPNTTATAITTTTPMAILYNLLTTSVIQQSAPTTASLFKVENVKAKQNMSEVKKVDNNSFAYVVNFLSNNIYNREATKTSTITKTKTTTNATTTKSLKATSRPTSVLYYNDFSPVNMWRNGSIATHKISPKRASKVVVGKEYVASKRRNQNTRATEGGGSFSCLVEVIEPQCECGWSSTVKIAGSSGVAGVNEFPSMAGIMTIKNQKVFCGASIIHYRYLLSAAHCFLTTETNTPEYLTAVVGEHDLSAVLDSYYTRQYDLIKIIRHENFKTTSSRVHNDIALLRTRYPIEWNRSVGPACLPFYALKYASGTVPYAGQRVETAGWGTTAFGGEQSSLLLKTTLDVLAATKCQNFIKNLPHGTFCTYTPGVDTCQYDSGGALYTRGERLYAIGIISYGYACATPQPSVNTRIASYLKWIVKKTPEVKYCIK